MGSEMASTLHKKLICESPGPQCENLIQYISFIALSFREAV